MNPTFGLVTAMPEEFHAMRTLLDDPVHIRVTGDRADYVAGTLPSLDTRLPHDVVLTLTADTGTHATADACNSLVTGFRTVNVVVMVGIAAGVPAPSSSNTHIRLGDVVVATWGIVDYSHIVQKIDGDGLRQPFPRPSALLTRADRMLQAGEYGGERPWENWLNGHRRGHPAVHRGRIGSADVSLHDPGKRDALASRYGLLAFEMEGAGIGNSTFLHGLEWFMVRGISDYADENVGTRWRHYASLVAAAYVRALLGAASPISPRGGYPLANGPVPGPHSTGSSPLPARIAHFGSAPLDMRRVQRRCAPRNTRS